MSVKSTDGVNMDHFRAPGGVKQKTHVQLTCDTRARVRQTPILHRYLTRHLQVDNVSGMGKARTPRVQPKGKPHSPIALVAKVPWLGPISHVSS